MKNAASESGTTHPRSDGADGIPAKERAAGVASTADLRAASPRLDPWTAVSTLLAQSPDPVQVCDTAGRRLYVNEAYRTLFDRPAGGGTPRSEAGSLDAAAGPLIRRATVGEVAEMPAAWYKRGADATAETGAPAVYGSLRASPLRATDGTVALIVLQFTDRTGEKGQEPEHLRERFLAAASHELRTPLTTLLGYTQLLVRRVQRGEGADRLQPSVVNILRAGRRLDRLVTQLIDVSRLDQGTLTLHREPCDLRALVAEVVEEIAARDPRRPIQLDAPAALPGYGDAGRIEQVIYSVLDNAVRYGRPDSAITVHLRDAGDRAVIRVENDGDPIDESTIARFFDSAAHRATPAPPFAAGLGLGLRMSRATVHAHGGTITAVARPGGGLTVTVSLLWQRTDPDGGAGHPGSRER